MPTQHEIIRKYLGRLSQKLTVEEVEQRLAPSLDSPSSRITGGSHIKPGIVERRWQLLKARWETRAALLDEWTVANLPEYEHNIENCVGTVKMPVGIAGPLRIKGLFARGDYYIPLATTEAALVASYNRGAQLISSVGGCTSVLLHEGISRAPGFAFRTIVEAGQFAVWCTSQVEAFAREAEATTQHGKMTDLSLTIEGNHVYLKLDFTTGDASGQNMVTIAAKAVCDYIAAKSPVQPQYSFIEANLSGDKKATALSFLSVRGKKVGAEVILPAPVVSKWLRATPEAMVNYWRMSAVGGVQSGSIGIHGHYANGLAALYIACGQDPACVAESAVGITRFDTTEQGDLYASVTMPNIVVGTIGGGTGLPTQRACMEILGVAGAGHSQELAEICAGVALAGELSIVGVLCAGDFAPARQRLARHNKTARNPSGNPDA
jgi:hydroxymethylglutaryl-CoA reductase (NADPH)